MFDSLSMNISAIEYLLHSLKNNLTRRIFILYVLRASGDMRSCI